MLHTRYRGNRSVQKKIFEWFYHIHGRDGHLGHATQIPRTNFRPPPLHKKAPHKVWLLSGKRFLRRRCLSIVDDVDEGRRMDAGPLVSYKLTYEHLAQVS